MGAVFISTNHFQKALDHFEQTRILQLEIFPWNHLETARTMNNISIALYKLNRFEDSLTYIVREVLLPTDPFRRLVEHTLITIHNRLNPQ